MDWKELDRLASLSNEGKLSGIGEDNFNTMLELTEKEDEHPDWYNNACYCRLCMSYA